MNLKNEAYYKWAKENNDKPRAPMRGGHISDKPVYLESGQKRKPKPNLVPSPENYSGDIRIRYYANRKFYVLGTSNIRSCYVEYSFIEHCLRVGKRFFIIQHKTNEDLTRRFLKKILAQQLFDELDNISNEEIKLRIKEELCIRYERERISEESLSMA